MLAVEDCVIVLAANELNVLQDRVKLCIPSVAGLLESIQHQLEVEDLTGLEARGVMPGGGFM